MRAFKYIGAEGETDAFGFRFPRGEPVEIDENAHPHAVKKLAANQWFKEVEPVEDAVIVERMTHNRDPLEEQSGASHRPTLKLKK